MPPLPPKPAPERTQGDSGAPTGSGSPRAVSRPSAAPAPVDVPGRTKDLLQAVPKVEIPKGGGAVRGIGEKFQANPVTGTAGFSVPITLSPGRNGFQPSLTLSYDSGAGNGIFGLGWNLAIPSVKRKTDKGIPRYRDASDEEVFVLSEAEDLVPWQDWSSGSETWSDRTGTGVYDAVTYATRWYRPRVEAGFSRIERWTHPTTGAVHWQTRSRENVLRIYGRSASAKVVDPDDTSRVFEWLLEEEQDELGNVTRYVYETVTTPDTGIWSTGRSLAGNTPTYTYPARIYYGNVSAGPPAPADAESTWRFYFEVVFDYGESTDDAWDGPATGPVRLDPFSRYRSGFDIRCTRLCRRVLVFHRFDTDGTAPDDSGLAAVQTLVRSTELTYTASEVGTTVSAIQIRGWNADGTSEVLPAVSFTYQAASIASEVRFLEGVDDLPQGLDISQYQWVDLDGEGLSGLLTEQGGSWYYKRNNGNGELAPAAVLPTRPVANLGAGTRLMDLDGDGRLEVVQTGGGAAGSWARARDGTWEDFRPFLHVPRPGWDDPRAKLLDLDGDGFVDLLLADELWLTWFQSEGRDGFVSGGQVGRAYDETTGPVALYSTETDTVFLADMNGDGLTDIVWVRNGSVCYWPNKGYGKFGARVQMANAPIFDNPERFDARRIRLGDIDGAGPADLVYLGPSQVRYWLNRSGNGLGSATSVPVFPGVDSGVTISIADVLGDGTQCLVWSSKLLGDAYAPLRYVRLMQEGKPYLLKSVDNGLGRTTSLEYRPSTRFYVDDRRAGTPWATRLNFPVQCLWRSTVSESVTGWSMTTEYAYHHGYFDGEEREFRGFGKVEQWDVEAYPEGSTTTDLPSVRTVTWFHTGAWQEDGTLQDTYTEEYFLDASAFDRTEIGFESQDELDDYTTTEWREAYRSLKGKPLRQEVYAEDGIASETVPYAVTETAYTVRRIQRADADTRGVFFVAPLQTLTYHYERDTSDPRIQQERTLSVDRWGNVTRAAALAYKRRGSGHEAEQTTGVTMVTETEVINDTATANDRWHVGVPWRVTSWHLTVPATLTYGALHTGAEIDDAFDDTGTEALDWDETPTGTDWKRRVSDQIVTYQDGAGEGTPGAATARTLVWQTYQLAFTTTQATALLTLTGDPTSLSDAGYFDLTAVTSFTGLDVDGHWARSGTQTRDSAHFYVPTTFTDPFANATDITWHATYLFPTSVEDALGNVVLAEYDFRALAPVKVTDPNTNFVEAAFDALGRVTKIAVTGKSAGEGDSLSSPTSEFAYHLDVVPAYTWSRQRETHGAATTATRWIERTAYSDGHGKVVMEKVTAAIDPVTLTDRWIGTGRVVLNNKGLPIKQYEPFYATTDDFEPEAGFSGVTPILSYDPVGRATKVTLPNGTLRYIEFDPWSQTTWDENDSVGHVECTATATLKARAAAHVDTPTTVHLDTLGRAYRTDERLTTTTTHTTRLTLDIAGNPTVVTDALGIATQTQTFDLLGRPIQSVSPDAGTTTALVDVAGQPVYVARSGSLTLEYEYDALRRRTHLWVTSPSAATRQLKERNLYGELVSPSPTAGNHRGRLYRQYDTAGVVTQNTYDFKGNPLSTSRRLWASATSTLSGLPFNGVSLVSEHQLDWTPINAFSTVAGMETAAAPELSSETFTTTQTWDAMGRVVTQTTPDASVTSYTYDDGAMLETVGAKVRGSATTTTFVSDIAYNARGQRESIDYGPSTGTACTTAYTYETDTFRLSELKTTRTSDAKILQDLIYTYDPVGNIVVVENNAEDVLYFNNTAVSPDAVYVYDALYRLTSATGREQTSLGQVTWQDPAFGVIPDANTAMQLYMESYTYDAVGNILTMVHATTTSGASWTRTYTHQMSSGVQISNRLATTSEGTLTRSYAHDARGSIVNLPHLNQDGLGSPNIETGFRDQMVRAVLNGVDEAVYLYDSAGQRVRKVVKRGQWIEDRIYFGGYEVWRRTNTVTTIMDEERQTLPVMDGERRDALVETKTVNAGAAVASPVSRQRFQLTNHLESSMLEVDQTGLLISYEEYHPYGSTAWQARNSSIDVSAKRYRYTGKEKDEETGMYYHGARYYAPWLGRWASADPIGLGDGVNRYAYVHGNPIHMRDISGLSGEPGWAPSGGTTLTRNEPVAVTGDIEDWMSQPLVVNAQWNSSTAEEAMRQAGIDTVEEVADLRRSAVNGVASVKVESELDHTVDYRLAVPTLSSASRAALGPIANDVEMALAIVYAPAPMSSLGNPYATPGDDYTHFHLAYKESGDPKKNRAFVSAFQSANAAVSAAKSDSMRAQSAYLTTLLGGDRSGAQYGLLWHTTLQAQSRDERDRVLLLPLDADLPVKTAASARDRRVPGWQQDALEFQVIYGGKATPLQGITIIIDPNNYAEGLPELLQKREAAGKRR